MSVSIVDKLSYWWALATRSDMYYSHVFTAPIQVPVKFEYYEWEPKMVDAQKTFWMEAQPVKGKPGKYAIYNCSTIVYNHPSLSTEHNYKPMPGAGDYNKGDVEFLFRKFENTWKNSAHQGQAVLVNPAPFKRKLAT